MVYNVQIHPSSFKVLHSAQLRLCLMLLPVFAVKQEKHRAERSNEQVGQLCLHLSLWPIRCLAGGERPAAAGRFCGSAHRSICWVVSPLGLNCVRAQSFTGRCQEWELGSVDYIQMFSLRKKNNKNRSNEASCSSQKTLGQMVLVKSDKIFFGL